MREGQWRQNPIPGNEVFRKRIPWVADLALVITGFGERSTKLSVYVQNAAYRKVAGFFQGTLSFTDPSPAFGNLSDAEKLCMACLPKEFPVGRSDFHLILKDQFWKDAISVAAVHYVLHS